MYLKAFYVDSTLGTLTWIVTGPEGFTAAVTNETVIDSATKVGVSAPDLEGTYTTVCKIIFIQPDRSIYIFQISQYGIY